MCGLDLGIDHPGFKPKMMLHQNMRWRCASVILAFSMGWGSQALAWLDKDQLDRLGRDLTPVGAERAGNKAGSIPAWDGGWNKPPIGFDPKRGWISHYPEDKPLYLVTRDNMDRFKDRLSPGQQALLRQYPGYKLPVYTSRRSAAYPQEIYDAVREEAAGVSLDNDGNAVVNVKNTRVPFPLPKSGVEVMWNSTFRFRGQAVLRDIAEFPVQLDGSFTPVRREELLLFGTALQPPVPNVLLVYRTLYRSPPSLAGQVILVHELIDQVKQPRAAWIYSPEVRRVRRAPEFSYDSARDGTESLSTVDDYDGFSGSPDRFSWKLLGKREMLVSYNNNRLTDKGLKYTDIARRQTLNSDLLRYELHRVWVVEGSLRPGMAHQYGRRTYYIDEDTWQVVHADLYDTQGNLWRVLEQHGVQFYDAPCFWIAGSAQYDLKSGRYMVSGLSNEERPMRFNAPLLTRDFTADALRRAGK